MKKTFAALLAVASLAAITSTPASAQRWVAPAVGGAIVGGAIAANPYYYGPGPYYYGPAPYYAPGYAAVAEPPYGGCYWQRQRFWDGYAWRIRRVQVCE